jgi:hypothetical protein
MYATHFSLYMISVATAISVNTGHSRGRANSAADKCGHLYQEHESKLLLLQRIKEGAIDITPLRLHTVGNSRIDRKYSVRQKLCRIPAQAASIWYMLKCGPRMKVWQSRPMRPPHELKAYLLPAVQAPPDRGIVQMQPELMEPKV